MFDFKKSENMKAFEHCITDIVGKEVAPMSVAVYKCWKLFNSKYGDMPNWKKSATQQREWLSYLEHLAQDDFDKEMSHDIPCGTCNGVTMAMLFFKAIALNEDPQTINAMFDYMEKFNRIGYQISQTPKVQNGFQYIGEYSENSLSHTNRHTNYNVDIGAH